ncbi:hypothetical protein, partial [Stenotrophomonas lactitubi]|uniref:hypothetical protein n=1 Tax=Stenotrophomonas lactitubi TaxID=2045214 RepID=UPI0028A29F19
SLYAKKSNQKKRSAGREPMLRIGALRSSANQGPVPNSLCSDIGTSSPLIPLRCSARFKADPSQTPQLHPVDPRHAWMLLLCFSSPP